MNAQSKNLDVPHTVDPWLVLAVVALLVLGLVMVVSASITLASTPKYNDVFYFVRRQAIALGLGLLLASVVWQLPLRYWEKFANVLLFVAVVMLGLVLFEGIGTKTNGAYRWISFGVFNLQVSELAKLLVIVYFAHYLSRHGVEIQESMLKFALSFVPLMVVAALVLAEPDLGATGVMVAAVLGMYFMYGARLSYFGMFFGSVAAVFVSLIIFSPWRLSRMISFTQACEPEYAQDQGYQLCQALIAFSRGEWVGVGLGSSVQKLFYLPEAHTDFLLAVLGEELGLFGSLSVIALFLLLVFRIVRIAQQAARAHYIFGSMLAYGIAFWLGVQAFINIAVNMGLLPTKGLTLPLMSYGGSSMIVTCLAVALVMRVYRETNTRRVGAGVSHKIWAVAS